MPKPENIEPYKFKKGQSGNPNGRPRKFVCVLKEQGYKLSEVNDTIQVMMAMTVEELKAVWDNPQATVMEKTIASAIKKSIEKGSLYSLETLLTRVYGKPTEHKETDITINKGSIIIDWFGNNSNNANAEAKGSE